MTKEKNGAKEVICCMIREEIEELEELRKNLKGNKQLINCINEALDLVKEDGYYNEK